MVNPDEITNYNRTDRELEEFMVFAICAAGKNANTTATILNRIFLDFELQGKMPVFHLSKRAANLANYFRIQGIGCYNSRAKTIRQLHRCIQHDSNFLKIATVGELENVHGIGPKTARFFIMHSRPNQRVAALDTHILKELKAEGYSVPKATPPAGKRYNELEQLFIQLADKSGMSVADYDLAVWKKWRKKEFVVAT